MEKSDCICDGLYLGGILAALNENDLAEKEITHILSLDENPLPEAITKNVTYKHVEALDMIDSDLLNAFPETFVFIEQARNHGGHVLVHCQAGMSRSATIVCAYLMQKMSTSKSKALEMIAACRPCIRPNEGFMEQLDLFEAMGAQLIRSHPQYRSWQLRKIADRFQSGYYSSESSDMDALSNVLLETDFSTQGNDAYYKCRKCRFILFRGGAVTSHPEGCGESAFDWRGSGRSKHSQQLPLEQQTMCQKSLFVDPLVWMKGKINETNGKLHCPKCGIKIGSYVWYGEKCPCGTWVAPAFHVDAGKVDRIPFQTVLPNARVIPRGATNITPLSREAMASPQTHTPLPHSFLPQDPSPATRGLSTTALPPHCRSLSARSGSTVVAAVTPLISTATSVLSSSSDASASQMEMETGMTGGSSQSSRVHSVGLAAPLSSVSALQSDPNIGMDVDL